jgi:Antitoxin of toxin-antitoxin, RelE / RelB, TA system
MASTKVPHRRAKDPKIVVAEHLLTILLAKDNGFYCAKCPELDLVTELPTADAAMEDLIEAIQDYAKEYLRERDRYSTSPNRAHHMPYIEAIAACRTDWELRTLIEIKHGRVNV